jgi:uncharacterized protein YkwD
MHLAARTIIVLVLAGLPVATDAPGARAAAPCSGGRATPSAGSPRQSERSALCLINAQRRAHGLRRLRSNPLLRSAAVNHSRDMVADQFFSHTDPDGTDFVARIRETGYIDPARYWRVGETIGWGTGAESSPGAVVHAWMHSPPHRKIILSPDFRSVGIGIAIGGHGRDGTGATYTADFGNR